MRVVGRYALDTVIASGGMATVHLGRLLGPVGFSRTVAIKRLHPQYAREADFVSMFLDEARLVARIHHPNVVQTLDVVTTESELLLVMEYIAGESLARLLAASVRKREPTPLRVCSAIMAGVLDGLHAAHEAHDERGEQLGIVHRDVSPQNVLVGPDGVARVVDFGIATARGRLHTTQEGEIKGKLAYMAPEQVQGGAVDRRCDVFAASVVLWEMLTSERMFDGGNEARVLDQVINGVYRAPSTRTPGLPPELDAIVMRGLARDPRGRFASAREMARAIEQVVPPAPASEVGEWVESLAHDVLVLRAKRVRELESGAQLPNTRAGRDFVEDLAEGARRQDSGEISAPGMAPTRPDVRSAESVPTTGRRSGAPVAAGAPPFVESQSTAAPVSRAAQLSFPQPVHDSTGRNVAIAALASVLLVGLVGAGAFVASRRTSAPVVAGPTAPSVVPSPLATAAPTPPSPEPARLEATPSAEGTETHAAATADAGAGAKRPAGKPRPSPAKPQVDCSVPYTRDELGRKIYKMECIP